MKETQIDGAAAVSDAHHQRATPTKHYLRNFDDAFDLRFAPEAQCAYWRQTRTILIAQRQMEQQVADARDTEFGEMLGDLVTDSVEARDGLIQRDRAGHGALLRKFRVMLSCDAREWRPSRPPRHAAGRPRRSPRGPDMAA